MRFRFVVLAAVSLVVVGAPVALAHIPGPPTAGSGRVCTAIGCQSGVFFDAAAYLATHKSVQRVRVCALGRCRSLRRGVPALAQPLVMPVAQEQKIKITVTAFGRRGRIVLRRKLVARLRKVQPNGPHCQPLCFQVNVLLSRSGVLTERLG